MDRDDEVIEPCPFCGTAAGVDESGGIGNIPLSAWVICLDAQNCLYTGRAYPSRQEAIEAHNRLSTAVREVETLRAENLDLRKREELATQWLKHYMKSAAYYETLLATGNNLQRLAEKGERGAASSLERHTIRSYGYLNGRLLQKNRRLRMHIEKLVKICRARKKPSQEIDQHIQRLHDRAMDFAKTASDLRSIVYKCLQGGYIPINSELYAKTRKIFGEAETDRILARRSKNA